MFVEFDFVVVELVEGLLCLEVFFVGAYCYFGFEVVFG